MLNKNKPEDSTTPQKTLWHRLLVRLLELILSPLDIEVQPDVNVIKVSTRNRYFVTEAKNGQVDKSSTRPFARWD